MEESTNTMEAAAVNREGKYLTFSMADEEYGIGILKVKEIIGMMTVTMVPQTPSYVKGVINLRGKIIPVVSLRLKFGLEEIGYTDRTCIIVVEVKTLTGSIPMGVMVDEVSEVLNIRNAEIEDTPTFGTSLKTDFILGMAKTGNRVKILLDIDKVISGQEMEIVLQAA